MVWLDCHRHLWCQRRIGARLDAGANRTTGYVLANNASARNARCCRVGIMVDRADCAHHSCRAARAIGARWNVGSRYIATWHTGRGWIVVGVNGAGSAVVH